MRSAGLRRADNRTLSFEGPSLKREELSARFVLKDRRRLGSDSARAYEHMGEGFLQATRNLRAVLWDWRRDNADGWRDRTGAHPWFLFTGRSEFHIAPSIDTCWLHPESQGSKSAPAIFDYIADSWPILGETFYASSTASHQ